MKWVCSLWVLLASLLLMGCGGDGPASIPFTATPPNQVCIGTNDTLDLVRGEEVWHGTFYSPCDETDIFLYDADGLGVALHFPANLNKVAQDTYPILRGATAPLQGGCRVQLLLRNGERELRSGQVEVIVSTIDYTITLSGIDNWENEIQLTYKGPLEYRSEGYTGLSDLCFDGGAVNDLGLLILHSYGWTTARRVGATIARIAARPSEDLDGVIAGELTFFHNADNLPAGIYTFPATTAGTFRGHFTDSASSYVVSDGSIRVEIANDQYSLYFDALTLLDEQTDEPHILTGSYYGPSNVEDYSGAANKPLP